MRYLVALTTVLSMIACGRSQPHEPGASDQGWAQGHGYTLSGPYTHANLSVFLLHKPGVSKDTADYLTLEEALAAKKLKVTEKSEGAQVDTLEVENVGDKPVYLQAGDTVKGGQQDRTIGVDFVLPPGSGKIKIDAFCVEPGRWASRSLGSRSAGGPLTGATFSLAEAPVATKEQKLAVKLELSQDKVWEEGQKVNRRLAAASSGLTISGTVLSESYVLTTEDPEVKRKTLEYAETLGRILEGKDDAVGMAFAIDGEPNTVDLYSSPALFRKLWPKLLKGASLEALSKQADQAPTRRVTEEDMRILLSRASDGKARTRNLTQDVRLETIDASQTAAFETRVRGQLLHRQVIKK